MVAELILPFSERMGSEAVEEPLMVWKHIFNGSRTKG